MANMSLPPEERNLTPDQVEALDMRRRRGSLLLVLGGMFTIIAVLLTCWVGQDLQYAPGFSRPMTYYFLVACGIVMVTLISGLYLRRGAPEIHSSNNHSTVQGQNSERSCSTNERLRRTFLSALTVILL